MNQYEQNVQNVMSFLEENNYSYSNKRLHIVCYQLLKKYLTENNRTYSPSEASIWLECNKKLWSKRQYTGYRNCLAQLEDMFSSSTVSLDHIGPHTSNYYILSDSLRQEVDQYLDFCIEKDSGGYINGKRVACSRFMMFLHSNGIKSIRELDYAHVLEFHNRDYHRSWKTKDIYEDYIRAMLKFFAESHMCKIGYSLILNKLLLPHVVFVSDFKHENIELLNYYRQASQLFSASKFLDTVTEFHKLLESYRYATTVKVCSRHILTLLYLFLDMNDLGYMPEISWIWFEEVKPFVGTIWKQWRRTLKLFELFSMKGTVNPSIMYTYKQDTFDSLPEWCQNTLASFLALKRREGMTKSTIKMYKASCQRLCQFLCNSGIESFDMLKPCHLNAFNENDAHKTPEGKNAYNVRIRGFLEYLEDQKLISGQMLHLALPCVHAPRERIVDVLTESELQSIDNYRSTHHKPIELRNIAIVMLGLKMGLRASDIVNLKFSDIAWKTPSITIIQQKTQTELSLPLPTDVGNSIYTYISLGRPISTSAYIFIIHTAPYSNLGKGACFRAINQILPERISYGKGFHVTRRTFATTLLRHGSSVNLIVDTLGHKSEGTVLKYLSLDEEKMQLCPLTLHDAGIPLKGGLLQC